jgi:cobalt/nickel transport system permease protein
VTAVVEARPAAPDWLTRSEIGLCPCGCVGPRRRGDAVAKTINGAAGVMRQAIYADDMAARPGLLQRIDPRTKLLGLLALLIVASLSHQLVVLLALYLVTLVLAWASRLPVWSFVKRVWLFVPIFTAVIVIPATLNLITPGHIVVSFGTWFGHPVGITAQGLRGAALITARVAASVSMAVLVTLTTRWPCLLTGLRSLHVPRLFVTVAAMAHRYIFHLLDIVTDVYVARRARTVRSESTVGLRRFVGASAGVLFGKSTHLTGEVHQAMVARGYVGEAHALDAPTLTGADVVAAAAIVALVGALLALGRAGLA